VLLIRVVEEKNLKIGRVLWICDPERILRQPRFAYCRGKDVKGYC
jgi:hypothetical protein